MSVPDHDLVTGIACEVYDFRAHLGVSVIGKYEHAAAVSVEGSLVRAHPDELGSVAVPVERGYDVAVGEHLAVPDFLSVAVMEIDYAVVAPVCGGGNLEAFPFRAVVGTADPLGMAVDVADYDLSVLAYNHEAFPAGDYGKTFILSGAELPYYDFIGVVYFYGQRPQELSAAVNHVVAGEYLVPAVAVEIV